MIQTCTHTSKRIEKTHQDGDASGETDLAVKPRPRTKKPSMFKVFLINDDYTPMEFVIDILETIFGKSHEDAARIMLTVHRKGLGLCGVYTYEIAETKVGQVLRAARAAQHPLQCKMERE